MENVDLNIPMEVLDDMIVIGQGQVVMVIPVVGRTMLEIALLLPRPAKHLILQMVTRVMRIRVGKQGSIGVNHRLDRDVTPLSHRKSFRHDPFFQIRHAWLQRLRGSGGGCPLLGCGVANTQIVSEVDAVSTGERITHVNPAPDLFISSLLLRIDIYLVVLAL